MKFIGALAWPDDVEDSWEHALQHVKSADWAIRHVPKRRVALQAGGNVGLWPRRFAQAFDRVITFEPDPISRECLKVNAATPKVEVREEALGAQPGRCRIKHRGLGSHRVFEGDTVAMITIDALNLPILDYLQLDIEGYEHHALVGARDTLIRCKPMVQVELRGFSSKYGTTTAETVQYLSDLGYREVSRQTGSDVVFQC